MTGAVTLADDLRRALDPVAAFEAAVGTPDPWQRELLRDRRPRVLLNASRQTGKSTTSAAVAALEIEHWPGSLVLLVSPSQRQSGELFGKVRDVHRAVGTVPVVEESATRLTLANRSRLVSLPGSERTVRGFSAVDLLVVDESARVPDDLYRAVRPMLAVSGGRLVALSTPFGRRGWWYDAWTNGGTEWHRVKVPATECERIPAEFLESERRALPLWFYRQEYGCEFESTDAAVFQAADILAAVSDDRVRPLWTPTGDPVDDLDDDDDDTPGPLWSDGVADPGR